MLVEQGLAGINRTHRIERSRYPEDFPAPDELEAIFALERVSGFGPMKFRDMHQAGIDPREAIKRPNRLPFRGRTGDKLREAIGALSLADLTASRRRAYEQIKRAQQCSASILIYSDPKYPKRVYNSNNPVPVLYVRGNSTIWSGSGSVALVGSRKTREPYATVSRKFAGVAAAKGMVIVSGFAIGADSIGHTTAHELNRPTVAVMPCGVDMVFPPENRGLWEQLLAYSEAAFVSEFGFGQRASALNLRKRNKLIVAFVQGVLVAQSAIDGGAMNAYRFAREQRKPVATFRSDGSTDTTGNAEIANDSRTGGVAFDLQANNSQYEKWITELSSSI